MTDSRPKQKKLDSLAAYRAALKKNTHDCVRAKKSSDKAFQKCMDNPEIDSLWDTWCSCMDRHSDLVESGWYLQNEIISLEIAKRKEIASINDDLSNLYMEIKKLEGKKAKIEGQLT